MGFSRRRGLWSERREVELDRVNEVIVGGLRTEIVVTGRNRKWFRSGRSRDV